jgi:uncharacterized protein YgbK (DUF1537 family)
MLLGCIADDFTAAIHLANTLPRRGMRTISMIGVSKAVSPEAYPIVTIVVALKSRTIPADQAVARDDLHLYQIWKPSYHRLTKLRENDVRAIEHFERKPVQISEHCAVA